MASLLQELAIFMSISKATTLLDLSRDVPWISPHLASDVHFKHLGQILGSVNYAHMRLDFSLMDIHNDIAEHCDASRTQREGFSDHVLNTAIKQLLEMQHVHCKRWELQFDNLVNVWVPQKINWNKTPLLQPMETDHPSLTPAYAIDNLQVGGDDFQEWLQSPGAYESFKDSRQRGKKLDQENTVSTDYTTVQTSDFEDFAPREARTHNHRSKRQLILLGMLIGAGIAALASAIFSHSQLTTIASQGPDQQVVHILAQHEKRTRIQNASIGTLTAAVAEMQTNLRAGTNTDVLFLAFAMKIDIIGTTLSRNVENILIAINLLSRHRLSPLIVNTITLTSSLKLLQAKAERKGLQLLSTRPEDLFRYETSHIIFQNGSISIFLHLPAFRADGMFQLLAYAPLPLPIPESSLFILPNPKDKLLAINLAGNLFRTLHDDDLRDCSKAIGVYYCPDNNVIDKRIQDSCLVALHQHDVTNIAKRCPIIPTADKDFVIQINSSHYALYQAASHTLDLDCGVATSSARFQGLRLVRVDPGCRLNTRSFVIDGQLGIFGDTISLRSASLNTSHLISDDLFNDLKRLDHQQLVDLSTIGNDQGPTIVELEKEFQSRRRTIPLVAGSLSFLSLLSLAVLTLILFKCRHFFHNRQRILLRLRPAQDEAGMEMLPPANLA